MTKAMILAATLALAACNRADSGEADTPVKTEATTVAPTDAGFEAVAPGNYEIVHADGTIDQLTVHPGLTWSMVAANGDASGGTIFAQAGKNCFVTEGVEGHQCFVGSEPEADGTMEVTAEDGEVMTVRPVESFEKATT